VNLSARSVRAALLDVIRPELEARGVGVAVEEVAVVLADEELHRVDGIVLRRRALVTAYGNQSRRRESQADAVRIREQNVKSLRAGDKGIIRHEDHERLGRLAGREIESAEGRRVVGARRDDGRRLKSRQLRNSVTFCNEPPAVWKRQTSPVRRSGLSTAEGKTRLPAPLGCRVRVLAVEGVGQRRPAVAAGEVSLVQRLNAGEVFCL